MKALIDLFWLKYTQLQIAVKNEDLVLVDALDREIDPILNGIYSEEAATVSDARLQFQFVLDLLKTESDDVSSVLRQSQILKALFDRYFLAAGKEIAQASKSSDFVLPDLQVVSAEDGALNEAILDQMPDRVSVLSADYRYIYNNARNAARLDHTPAELLGRHIVEFVGIQRFEQTIKPNIDKCFLGETVEYSFANEDGPGTTVVRCRLSPCKLSEGKIIGAILVVKEMADRRRSIAA